MNVFCLKSSFGPKVAIKDIFKGLDPFYFAVDVFTAIVAGFLPYIDAIF